MDGDGKSAGLLNVCTYSEKYKESLILFSYAVIDPGTVVIHLPDASFTNTAGRREMLMCHQLYCLRLHNIRCYRCFQKHSSRASVTM